MGEQWPVPVLRALELRPLRLTDHTDTRKKSCLSAAFLQPTIVVVVYSRSNRFACLHVDWCQPAEAVRLEAVSDGEELLCQLARDFARLAVSY